MASNYSKVGSNARLVLAKGVPHVVFANSGYSLHYATNGPKGWTVVEPELGKAASGRPAIAVDKKGFVHIAYQGSTVGAVRHLTNETGAWVGTTVDAPNMGGSLDMKLDQQGRIHIVFGDGNKKAMKYAVRQANKTFKIDPVAYKSAHGIGGRISLVLDSKDKAHIATTNPGTAAVYTYYVTNADSAGWSVKHLSSYTPYSPYFKMDDRGRYHVLVYTSSSAPCSNCQLWATNSTGTQQMIKVVGASSLQHCVDGGPLKFSCLAIKSNELRHQVVQAKCP